MKKIVLLALAAVLALSLAACVANEKEEYSVRIAALKGATGIGLVHLMDKAESGGYGAQATIYGTADEIVPRLINGEIDIALIPANLAAVLYNRTEGGVRVAAINTLGVLYILETGDSIKSLSDLSGKTIYSTGKGTTPEYALSYILNTAGIEATVVYKSESSEIASLLAEGEEMIAVLPQPYVTTVTVKNPSVRVALSLGDEWDKLTDDSRLVTAVVAVNMDFYNKHPEAFAEFMREYEASVKAALEDADRTAELCEKYGIVNAAIAKKALPFCGIAFITGDEMQTALLGYYKTLFDFNPSAVGGKTIEKDIFVEQ